jgi:predicted Zn-dependent peptidase
MAIYVAGDGELDTVVAALERAFGTWQAPAAPRGVKTFPADTPARPSRILLLDRPNSPQSFIAGGQPLLIDGKDDRIDLNIANEALGGTFTSRLNTDLRETKGWSYGVRSILPLNQHQMSFGLRAPVQADKTGPSITALVDNIRAFSGPDPVSASDLSRIVNSNIYTLPGEYETAGAVMLGMEANVLYDRPVDWYAKVPGRYRALDPATVARATAGAIDPARIQWVVVGDAKVVKPQLEALGLPLEVRPAP